MVTIAVASAASARATAAASAKATFKNSKSMSSSSSSRLVDTVMSIFLSPKFQSSNRLFGISSYCSFSERSPVQVFENYERISNSNSSSNSGMVKSLFCKSYASSSSSLQVWLVLFILLVFLGYKRVQAAASAQSSTELKQVAFQNGKNNRTRKSATKTLLDFRAIVQSKWDEFRTQKTERTAQMKQQLSNLKIPPSPFRILLPEEEDDLFFATSKYDESATATEEPWVVDSDDSEDDEVNANKSPSSFDGTTHFCFLVHGHRGHSRDLSYVQAVMRRCYKQTVSTATAAVSTANSKSAQQRLIVHSVTCNEKKTDDGVRAGGERLVDEMLRVIRNAMFSSKNPIAPAASTDASATLLPLRAVTISLWGNSLGGLYARYAIAALAERCRQSCRFDYDGLDSDIDDSIMILDDAYALRFNVFCTTATPHLGVSGHTFLSLPRTAEIGVASIMGETGKDLFRTNTLLWQMAVERQYTLALSHFRKRICYANAYGTDFPVPASTAAFLSSSSTYPHHFANTTELPTTVNDDDCISPCDDTTAAARTGPPKRQTSDSSSLVIATLHTTPSAMVVSPPPGRDSFGRSRRSRSTSRSLSTTSQDVNSSEHGSSNSESTNEFSTRSATVESRPEQDGEPNDVDLDDTEDDNDNENVNGSTLDDELAQMSMSLDSLGWKKVFVDMRKEVPRIAIPKSMIPSVRLTSSTRTMPTEAAAAGTSTTVQDDNPSNKDGASSFETTSTDSSSSSSSDEDGHESMSSVLSNSRPKSAGDAAEASSSSLLSSLLGPVSTAGTHPPAVAVVESMESLRGKGTVVSSKDVAAAVTTPSSLSSFWPSTTEDDEHLALHWPIGHNMIVAFSRSRWSTYMNRAGRPVVDALAQEIVTDILAGGSGTCERTATMLPQQRRLKECHAPE